MDLRPKTIVDDASPAGVRKGEERKRMLDEFDTTAASRAINHAITNRDLVTRQLQDAEKDIDDVIRGSNEREQELRRRR